MPFYTVEFRKLGHCFIDWADAVVGEADRELTFAPSPATAVAKSMKHRPNLQNLPVYEYKILKNLRVGIRVSPVLVRGLRQFS